MNDQDIYGKLGKLLYNETTNIDKEVHLLIYKSKYAIDMTLWCGDKRSKESIFGLTSKGVDEVYSLTDQLLDFYSANKLGGWNVYHYILQPNKSSFHIHFEDSKELESGKLPFWEYSRQFR